MANSGLHYEILGTTTTTQYDGDTQKFVSVKTHRVKLLDYGDVVEIEVIGNNPDDFLEAVRDEITYRDMIQP